MKTLGLIGKNISYSRSPGIFRQFFEREQIKDITYRLFDLENIREVQNLFRMPGLLGFNVTIPYKKSIISYLDETDDVSAKAGSVNTVVITPGGIKKGYNTDIYGIEKSLGNLENLKAKRALILGTGGTASAFAFVFDRWQIPYLFVSRNPRGTNQIHYDELTAGIISQSGIIVNTTPLGNVFHKNSKPPLPYEYISRNHLLFDVHYEPGETLFLKEGKRRGARVINGLPMLRYQAEKAWEIWKKEWKIK